MVALPRDQPSIVACPEISYRNTCEAGFIITQIDSFVRLLTVVCERVRLYKRDFEFSQLY